MKKIIFLFLCLFSISFSFSINLKWCKKHIFKVSAYYSAVYGQRFYHRWNFFSEIKLNGRWYKGASWKRVFNGMIAAWKKYKFWTKIYFPWLWVGQVEDRGSAIVNKWQRWEKYDRIDIWVGKWEKWLMRAMSFWKQIRIWYICPATKKLKVWFHFNRFFIIKNFFHRTLFSIWLNPWRKWPWVRALQDYLRKFGYLKHSSTGYFGRLTKKALIKFQKDHNIKTKYYGYFWPKTRHIMKELVFGKNDKKNIFNKVKNEIKKKIERKKVIKELAILKRWLYKWMNTYEVVIVQKYLKKLWY